jgi:hypothetical protein
MKRTNHDFSLIFCCSQVLKGLSYILETEGKLTLGIPGIEFQASSSENNEADGTVSKDKSISKFIQKMTT